MPEVPAADRVGAALPQESPDSAVLIVDDNPAKILALETAVAPLGVRIVTATSGRDALRRMLEQEFATVVLDVNMPGMDGFETAQLIRGRPRSAHTPIIFVSAINLADTDALRGYSLGAVDYILAPVIPEILRAKISVFVELQRKTIEARIRAAELEEKTRQLERSQQQLRVAERISALGTLCAGLGHDMGNMLLPIQARIDELRGAQLDEEVRSTIEGIGTCVGYLRKLAGGLRMLSFDPEAGADPRDLTSLSAWWSDTEPLLRNVLPRSIALQYREEGEVPPVRIPRHLLTQIVFNLIQNAADVLRPIGRGNVEVIVCRAEEGVAITVADDGPGMTAEVRERCIEPFFTTKTRGISTGLGLALIHSTVHRIGGRLEVDSAPGKGARFTFVLPSAGDLPAVDAGAAFVEIADPRRRGLVLSLLSLRGVRTLGEDELGSATLWVTDSPPESLSKWRSFVQGRPGRRVLALGVEPKHQCPGVECVPDLSLPQIRRALWGSDGIEPGSHTPSSIASSPAKLAVGPATSERASAAPVPACNLPK